MTRRSLFASLSALFVAPTVPVTRVDGPLLQEIARLSRRADAIHDFLRDTRTKIELEEMKAYRDQVTEGVRA